MGTRYKLELAAGAFVALGLAAFFMLAMKVSNVADLGQDKGYRLVARFANVGGLKVRAPVSVGGVRIGRVVQIDLDPRSYEALVTLSIDPRYHLPVDSSASILTSGLLGEQYVGLEPGGMEEVLKSGDTLKLTQPALVLEKLIGRMLTNAVSGSDPPAKAP